MIGELIDFMNRVLDVTPKQTNIRDGIFNYWVDNPLHKEIQLYIKKANTRLKEGRNE